VELSALRILGLGLAAGLIAFAVWRRSALRNGDVLLLLAAATALAVVAATDLLDAILSFFSFERGGGGRLGNSVTYFSGFQMPQMTDKFIAHRGG